MIARSADLMRPVQLTVSRQLLKMQQERAPHPFYRLHLYIPLMQ